MNQHNLETLSEETTQKNVIQIFRLYLCLNRDSMHAVFSYMMWTSTWTYINILLLTHTCNPYTHTQICSLILIALQINFKHAYALFHIHTHFYAKTFHTNSPLLDFNFPFACPKVKCRSLIFFVCRTQNVYNVQNSNIRLVPMP